MKIKELTQDLLDDMLAEMQISEINKPCILDSAYVDQFNRGVAYRIQKCELSHSISADLATNKQFI